MPPPEEGPPPPPAAEEPPTDTPPRPVPSTALIPTRVAAAQLTSTADPAANFAAAARLAASAVAAGAATLFLPEAFAFMGESPADTLAAAQPLGGPRLASYRTLAASTGLWLSLGGFGEAGAPPAPGSATPRVWNTHVVVDPAGSIVAAYRKVHLFDAEGLMESAATSPGSGPPVVVAGTPLGPLGLAVCFDLRFAGFFDELQYGGSGGEDGDGDGKEPSYAARVIAIPAAFTVQTGGPHWEVLLRARAVETQAAVVAAAQAGRHNGKRASYGHACVVDAWGTVLARVGGAAPDNEEALHGEGLAVADLGEASVEAVRRRLPLAAARAKGRAAMRTASRACD